EREKRTVEGKEWRLWGCCRCTRPAATGGFWPSLAVTVIHAFMPNCVLEDIGPAIRVAPRHVSVFMPPPTGFFGTGKQRMFASLPLLSTVGRPCSPSSRISARKL
ncbi:unnamed protein product, partial [Phaeothamnion confervicola]